MKYLIILILIGAGFGNSSYAQTDSETLRKAIGYYQQMNFEKSIELFDELVMANPDDFSLIGRRGFVISEYLKAVDEKKVEVLDKTSYDALKAKGIKDLKTSLEKFPNNTDNKSALSFLEKKV